MKNQNGFTLVALVVSVIVMLIIAGASINMAVGNNGIVENSEKSVEKQKQSQSKEYILETWGYVLGKIDNISDNINNSDYTKMCDYFRNYISSYGIGNIVGVLKNASSEYILKIQFILKGENEEGIYYIIDDKIVLTQKEYDKKDYKNSFSESNI